MGPPQLISSSLIKMANPNSADISILQLTPWDLQLLQFDPIQKGILFYRPEENKFIDHLKASLSRALDYFPPLAGRLGTATNADGMVSFFVDCNNAGVEFTHAVAGTLTVADILDPHDVPDIVYSFFPLDGVINCDGVSKPLVGVQVTELADGFFLGCTANHAVVDGTSFWHFLNSWSEVCRDSGTISRLPVFKRMLPRKFLEGGGHIPIPLISEENIIRNAALPPLLQRFFHFGKESIAKLKARANMEAGMDNISSLQAISAHLWRGVVRSRNNLKTDQKPAGAGEVCFILVVGLRGRIPEIQNDYFGNAVAIEKMTCSEAEILEKGLGYAAQKINEMVGQQSGEAAIKYVEDWVRNPAVFGRLTGGGDGLFAIASTPRHNVYVNDFGWGKPVAVRSGKGQKFDGKMSFFPAAVSGGIDVEACLAPETLRGMENDAEFMEAFSQ